MGRKLLLTLLPLVAPLAAAQGDNATAINAAIEEPDNLTPGSDATEIPSTSEETDNSIPDNIANAINAAVAAGQGFLAAGRPDNLAPGSDAPAINTTSEETDNSTPDNIANAINAAVEAGQSFLAASQPDNLAPGSDAPAINSASEETDNSTPDNMANAINAAVEAGQVFLAASQPDNLTPGSDAPAINSASEETDNLTLGSNVPAIDATAEETDQGDPEENAISIDAAVEETDGTPPDFSIDECNKLLDTLVASDADDSNGLSEAEYYEFLSSIDDPPYISEFFGSLEDFNDLPWVFRVVHKSLACQCQKLGYGDSCCEKNGAEVLIPGMTNGNVSSVTTRDAGQDEYKDLICQQMSYVLTRSVPLPRPTVSPTDPPTTSPVEMPTVSPSASPTTTSPSVSPLAAPVPPPPPPEPTQAPTISARPTLKPVEVMANVTVEPEIESLERMQPPEEVPDEEGGMPLGAIIGIVVAAVVLLLVAIGLVAYRRRREQSQLREFAGEQALDSEFEAPSHADEEMGSRGAPGPETSPPPSRRGSLGNGPDEDDESSALSVWSASAGAGMHDDNNALKGTVGSSLAAMGAASTLATNQMSPATRKPAKGVLS